MARLMGRDNYELGGAERRAGRKQCADSIAGGPA